MRQRILATAAACLATATGAAAQPGPMGGWLIEVIGGPVSPSNPSTTIRVSAYFPSHLHGFYGGRFDLVGSDPTGAMSNFFLPAPLGPLPPGPHGCIGLIVLGAVPGGYRFSFLQEGIVGCFPHPANPLPILEAQWTTNDFTPRVVDLETRNTPGFLVWVNHNGTWTDLIPLNQFRHGSAVIQVIPAPGGAALLLAASGAVMLRRRRRMSIRM